MNLSFFQNKKIIYLVLLICFITILSSIPFFAHLDYFWVDFKFAEHAHTINSIKEKIEVLPNTYNINAIPIWIINPSLNFLSTLNYEISSRTDYYLYLFIFRLLELITVYALLFSFINKVKILDVLIITAIYLILLVNFNRYDHESYINFPIIVLYLFLSVGVRINNNSIFFILMLIGNLWAYLINPIYFFNICFFPLLFFYWYYLSIRKLKKLFLLFLANLPFTILFILLSVGSSRFALSDYFLGSGGIHQNFTLFTSLNFKIISIIFILLIFLNYKKIEKFSLFFLLFTFFSIILGFIFLQDLQNWKVPAPFQFEYASQYFLILIFYQIIKNSEQKKIFFFCSTVLVLLGVHKLQVFTKYLYNYHLNKDNLLVQNNFNFSKRNFWSKENNKFFFKNDLKNKNVFINLPNQFSDYHKSLTQNIDSLSIMRERSFAYNNNFNGSVWFPYFWNNEITINSGYSHHLDINSVKANYFNPSQIEIKYGLNNKKYLINLTDNKILKYQIVPDFNYKNYLISFYNFDFILSDVVLDEKNNQNKISLEKTYEFENFNLFLYKIFLNDGNSTKINKTNKITNYLNYKKNIYKFTKEIFVDEENYELVSNIKNFCNVSTIRKKNKIFFKIKLINTDKCLPIFPIPFSHNNIIQEKSLNINSNIKCNTFRVQYYFHGCIINKDKLLELKKNNFFNYHVGSLKDFLDFKRLF